VLSSARVEVKGGRVGDISSRVIRDDGDIIAYLVLLRPPLQRTKRTAHCHVRRPGNSAVGTIRVEQLRIGVVRRIPRIQPHGINAAIGRDGDRAEIVPLVVVNWIIVDPVRRGKGNTSVGAANEHHIRPVIGTKRLHAGHHVNVVVSRSARPVHRQECLACQSAWINCAAENDATAHVNRGDLIKRWRHTGVLSVGRADAPETAPLVVTANKQVAIGSHVQ